MWRCEIERGVKVKCEKVVKQESPSMIMGSSSREEVGRGRGRGRHDRQKKTGKKKGRKEARQGRREESG